MQTIINLGQSLGMTVTAEGVETEAQLQALQRIGCDTFQGFLYSRPVPVEQFVALVRARSGVEAVEALG